MQNIVKMTTFLTHFDYIETYRKVRDEFIQEPFSPNPAVFKHCDGKQNKIRWLKVHITIRILSHRLIAVLGYHYKEPKSRKTPIFYINSAMWSSVLQRQSRWCRLYAF